MSAQLLVEDELGLVDDPPGRPGRDGFGTPGRLGSVVGTGTGRLGGRRWAGPPGGGVGWPRLPTKALGSVRSSCRLAVMLV